mmetsp:Transcript_11000/g.18386  ORF Transcript_11000/g.18386 Transcript_11000/m.18386 type:complete len:137 (+) Transcript_11000:584-994(+)
MDRSGIQFKHSNRTGELVAFKEVGKRDIFGSKRRTEIVSESEMASKIQNNFNQREKQIQVFFDSHGINPKTKTHAPSAVKDKFVPHHLNQDKGTNTIRVFNEFGNELEPFKDGRKKVTVPSVIRVERGLEKEKLMK